MQHGLGVQQISLFKSGLFFLSPIFQESVKEESNREDKDGLDTVSSTKRPMGLVCDSPM